MPDLFEILAEPRRQAILRLVWSEEKTAGDIAKQFDVTFGAVSQHLAILRDAHLVDQRKQGRQRLYKANRQTLGPIALYLESMWNDKLGRLKTAAEREEKARWKKSKSKSR
ncbi:MAG TPA: metalloregulator ArsR/SmtB family transcription factor [Bryobacteraceae bacterium]|nr:metalloregulator ArsR/SmtB family transcription factor [Bryobacteraceae bacterium]